MSTRIKIILGNNRVIISKILSIDCPNVSGGIGYITFNTTEGFWTGYTHIYGKELQCSFGSITEIQTRSNLYESDEEWKTIWQYVPPFSYSQFHTAAEILKSLTN